MKVFISGVFIGLKDIRGRLRKAIAEAGDVPIGMENFGARAQAPRDVSLEELRTTDVVVLIVGPRYGKLDSISGLSNTHLEFREAQHYDIPILAFALPEDPALTEEEASRLETFRSEVALSALTYRSLDNANNLPERALASLKHFDSKRAELPGQFSPFQCAEDFFAALLDRDALFNHSYKLVGRGDTMEQLADFINGSAFAAILSGAGGVGKSRILLEFAKRQNDVVFLGPQFELKPEHLRQLPREADCIVIDDAHRLESLESLVQLVKSWSSRRTGGLQLLLTCRPSGLNRLRSAVCFLSQESVLELPELLPLDPQSSAYELAIQVIGADKPDLAKMLAEATDGNPLLITVGGQLLRRDQIPPAMLAQKGVFQSVALDNLISELPADICGVSSRDLLAVLAAIGPVRPDREPFCFQMLAGHLHVPTSSIVSAMAALRSKYRLLIKRGFSLRVHPDVLGDHLLAQAAVADGTATGFIEEVFEAFGEKYLSNILANASELEWRLGATESSISVLSGIWAVLREELPRLTYHLRVGLLKKLEAAAWFAPSDVWKILSWMLDHPEAPAEAIEGLLSYPNTQEDVIRQAPRLVSVIALHAKLTRDCARLLWEISVGDDRPLNATPDHPLRVLGELLSFHPRKTPHIQEQALDGLEDGLKIDEKTGMSRDVCTVLTPLLSRNLGWSISDGAKITMYSRSLPASNPSVIKVRNRAIGLIARQSNSPDTPLAVKGVDALLDLLRPPFGLYGRKVEPAEVASWEKEVGETVDLLLKLVASSVRSVVAYIAKRGLEGTAAVLRFWPPIDKRIENVLSLLPDSEEFTLFDSLRPWAHLFRSQMDREASEEKHQERVHQAVSHLWQTSTSSEELVRRVCHALEELHTAELNPNAWKLLNSLCDDKPKTVPQLAMAILGSECGILQRQAAVVYCRWFATDPRDALDEIKQRIEEDEENVTLGIANAYGWQRWLGEPETHTAEHILNIATLLKSQHWGVRKTALPTLTYARGLCEREALDVLLAADFGDDAELLDEALFAIDEKHGISPQNLTQGDYEGLLEKLRSVRDLPSHHYHIDQFVQLAAASCPTAVVDMFLSRIDYAASLPSKKADRYQPLPYRNFHQGFHALGEAAGYADLLRRIRDRVPREHYVYRFWIPQLYALASDGFCTTAVDVLREWSTSDDPEQVVLAAFLSREAGPAFAFTHDDFVAECLTNAEHFGEEVLRRARSNFHAGAASLSYHSAIGKPPQKMVQAERQADELAEKHKGEPIVSSFYRELADTFRGMIAESLTEDEEFLDQ